MENQDNLPLANGAIIATQAPIDTDVDGDVLKKRQEDFDAVIEGLLKSIASRLAATYVLTPAVKEITA